MGRTSIRSFIVVAGVLALALVAPQPASAHGRLVSSIPAEGARLDSPTATVTLAFTEKPASSAFFAVIAPSGVRVDQPWSHATPFRLDKPVTEYQLENGQWQPREFHAGFPARIPVTHWPERGAYVVRYQTVASDGDTVQGEIRFTYAGATTPAPPGWRPPANGPSVVPAAAAATPSEENGRGPWPWLVPVLLVVAVAGAVALVRTERSKH
ncbi:copper resistance protein CopC [Actinoplanes sp. TBRC 11911]|uniref:copper resistance CopC family protein n=1 Tax=Actinoplanes sp. TBRC 11911 TaxID=2729386 RepID=UPI00145F2606|nr:copper resistance CopC family protein [Actinoplanes sp. TBRC 11911]NMO49877.1 copper resistance protein CopC [Actinoplanes sp. TBRC 11911]